MKDFIPEWMAKRFALIWRIKKNKDFTFRWYIEKTGDDEKIALTFFSRLKKKGWIEVKNNPQDKRKKLYKLVNPNEIFNELGEAMVIKNEH